MTAFFLFPAALRAFPSCDGWCIPFWWLPCASRPAGCDAHAHSRCSCRIHLSAAFKKSVSEYASGKKTTAVSKQGFDIVFYFPPRFALCLTAMLTRLVFHTVRSGGDVPDSLPIMKIRAEKRAKWRKIPIFYVFFCKLALTKRCFNTILKHCHEA